MAPLMTDAIAVLNAGSSSFKFSLFSKNADGLALVARGQAEGLYTSPRFVAKDHSGAVINEKALDSKHSAEELAKNLTRHGIDVVLDKVDANGKPIGGILESYVVSHGIDLLAMGAYGHSRWREFILGGATKSLMSKPPLPILFSH